MKPTRQEIITGGAVATALAMGAVALHESAPAPVTPLVAPSIQLSPNIEVQSATSKTINKESVVTIVRPPAPEATAPSSETSPSSEAAPTAPETTTPAATSPTTNDKPRTTTPEDTSPDPTSPDYGPDDDSDGDPDYDYPPTSTTPTIGGGKPEVTTPPEIAPALPEVAPKTPAEAAADLKLAIDHHVAYLIPDSGMILNHNQEPGSWQYVNQPAVIIDKTGQVNAVYETKGATKEVPSSSVVFYDNSPDGNIVAAELQGTVTEDTAESSDLYTAGLTATADDGTQTHFGQSYANRLNATGRFLNVYAGKEGLVVTPADAKG